MLSPKPRGVINLSTSAWRKACWGASHSRACAHSPASRLRGQPGGRGRLRTGCCPQPLAAPELCCLPRRRPFPPGQGRPEDTGPRAQWQPQVLLSVQHQGQHLHRPQEVTLDLARHEHVTLSIPTLRTGDHLKCPTWFLGARASVPAHWDYDPRPLAVRDAAPRNLASHRPLQKGPRGARLCPWPLRCSA